MKKNKLYNGIHIFIGYMFRQIRKNPHYKPHPLIDAYIDAMTMLGTNKIKCNGSITVNSQESKNGYICNPYIVVLKKKKDGIIKIEKIKNIKLNRNIDSYIMSMIFRLQIYLDRIKGDTVYSYQVANILTTIVPRFKFYVLTVSWEELRDELRIMIKDKIYIPETIKEIIEEAIMVKNDNPYNEHSKKLISLRIMGIRILGIYCLCLEKDDDRRFAVITFPKNIKIVKFKVIDAAIEFMLGKQIINIKPYHNNNEF